MPERRALITGGAGFVGSHLAETLLKWNWKVRIVDDLSTGSVDNIEGLKAHPRFDYTIDTVMDYRLMAEMVDWADVVFHLAAAVGVEFIVKQPVRTIETNIKATEIVLELAAKKNKKVLLASTSEVYGKQNGHGRFAEDDDVVLGPTSRSRWCYAASKMIDEFLAVAYARGHGLPVTILRLFNTIGPRQSGQYGMVVPRFVNQALLDQPITVYGDGSQQRSFTWVGDVVRVMMELVDHPEAVGEVFNVGHTKEITIRDLAYAVRDAVGSRSEIVYVPFEEAYEPGFEDMPRRLPDISKLQGIMDYDPSLDIGEMLDRIIEHSRDRLNGAPVTALAVGA